MTDAEFTSELRRHLDAIERNVSGEWIAITGDVRHYDVPGDLQELNTSASWLVSPTSRSRFGADRALESLIAIFDLIRQSYP